LLLSFQIIKKSTSKLYLKWEAYNGTQIGDSINLNNFSVSIKYINECELTTQLVMDKRNMSGNQKIVISKDRMSVTVYNFNYDILVDIEEYTFVKHSN